MEKKIIETIGFISKVETVKTLDHNILSNTLVLEAIEPFPGYHGANLPTDQPPQSIFMVTKGKFTFETINRAAHEIRKEFNHDFDAVYAELKVFNENYPSIRIMGLESFELIAELQKKFEKQGVVFMKSKSLSDCAIIKIHKTFYLEEIAEGIYQDLSEPEMKYVEVIKKIGWSAFQKATFNVKNNINYANFDAAIGYLYRNKGIVDMIRIYGKNITNELLQSIQKIYNEELTKL